MDSSMNNIVSFTWVKRVTEIGLTLMTPKAEKERVNSLIDGDTINAAALTDLITECAESGAVFVEKNDGRISTSDAELIKSLLGKIDAKDAVASADPDELAAWVRDMVSTVTEGK